MLRRGKAARAYVGSIIGDCRRDRLRHRSIAPNELWMKLGEQADHVVDHQDLSVAGDGGADCAMIWDAVWKACTGDAS